jgi:Uncharacterized protein family UPF0029/RWD domain
VKAAPLLLGSTNNRKLSRSNLVDKYSGTMSEDLSNEIEAINSIYGEGTLEITDQDRVYILHLPNRGESLRIRFPEDYPDGPPVVVGIQSSGEQAKRGSATHVVEAFRDAVQRLFRAGEVCLFDVIEDVNSNVTTTVFEPAEGDEKPGSLADANVPPSQAPSWIVSDVITELKSVFVARCAPVASPDQAKLYLQHLLETDKKVARATHNITAHRIRGENGVTFQDCDDDGETAAGGRILHLMQLMDLWDVMVVVTRWYGGQKLGPARFGIINSVARDAFVKGGFVQEQDSANSSKKKGKR